MSAIEVSAIDRAVFAAAWAAWSTALRASALRGSEHALPPPATHFSVIARLPPELAAALAAAVAPLRDLAPHHCYYPADSIHLTILNLDRARHGVGRADLIERIRRIVAAWPAFDVVATGLGVSPNTIFAQLFPDHRALPGLRRELARLRASGRSGDLPHQPPVLRASLRALGGLVRRIGFANLVRFAGPVTLPFIAAVARHRAEAFGRFTVSEVEIVETDRVLSRAGTRVLGRVSLASRASST